jgi:hypothetical protein
MTTLGAVSGIRKIEAIIEHSHRTAHAKTE